MKIRGILLKSIPFGHHASVLYFFGMTQLFYQPLLWIPQLTRIPFGELFQQLYGGVAAVIMDVHIVLPRMLPKVITRSASTRWRSFSNILALQASEE